MSHPLPNPDIVVRARGGATRLVPETVRGEEWLASRPECSRPAAVIDAEGKLAAAGRAGAVRGYSVAASDRAALEVLAAACGLVVRRDRPC